MSSSTLIRVLKLSTPHGIRGELKAFCLLEDPSLLKKGLVLEDEKGTPYTLEMVRSASKGRLILKLEGLGTPEAAKAYQGLVLYGPEDLLPPLDEDDGFYYHSLEGLEARVLGNAHTFRVTRVENYGASDILVLEDTSTQENFMVPFQTLAVPTVNVEEGYLEVDPAFLISEKGERP